MPGGGGIGLPLAPRSGGAGDSGSPSAVAGASGATSAGAADAAGATGSGAGAGRGAGASTGGGAAAAAGRSTGRAGGAAGAGAGAAAAGRTGSSSTRRIGPGRSLPLDVTRRAGALGGAGAGAGAGVGSGGAGASTGAGSSTTGAGAGGSGSATGAAAGAGAAAAFFVALAAFAGLPGSSGWTSRMRPSRSALRRTRSACASSMLDECVLTPIPSDSQRSSVSLFVIPSSLASSCTRFFAAKFLVQSFRVVLRGRDAATRPHHGRPSSHEPGGWHDSDRSLARRSTGALLAQGQDRFG